jgi:amino acid adenylation domain-containing protein
MNEQLETNGSKADLAARFAGLPAAKRALLNRWLDQQAGNGRKAKIPKRSDSDSAIASFSQQRIWFIDQLGVAKTSIHRPTLIRFSGALDVDVLRRVLQEIVRRHESLRTVFTAVDGELWQTVHKEVKLPWDVVDCLKMPESERAEFLNKQFRDRARQPFDLSSGPLIRAAVFCTGENEHLLALNFHHIVFDGWSEQVLFRELRALYAGFATGQSSPLPDLEVQYGDFAEWQCGQYTRERLESHLDYWANRLTGVPPLQLPLDSARPETPSFQGSSINANIPAEVVRRLQQLAKEQNATLFMVLLAAYKALLCRLTGQTDIAVACPVVGRQRSEVETLIGCFINLLVLRTEVPENASFEQLLAQVRTTSLEAYERQDVPLEKIVQRLSIERDATGTSLVSAMFNLMPVSSRRFELGDLTAESITPPAIDAKFDLSLAAHTGEDDVHLRLDFNQDVFGAESARRILKQYLLIVQEIAEDSAQSIFAPSLITQTCEQIVPDPRMPMRSASFSPLTELVEEWARKTPEAAAIVCGRKSWKYQDLARDFHHLARELASQGVLPGDVVGVSGPPSYRFMVALLAVQRCRAAALPLDQSLPKMRAERMLAAASTRLMVSVVEPGETSPHDGLSVTTYRVEGLAARSNGKAGANVSDGRQLPAVLPDDSSFVFYTSGSTGTPKGILGWHGAYSQSLAWHRETFGIGPGLRFAQTCALSFEAVVREIFLPLTSGATLCLPESADDLSPQRFWTWLADMRITTVVAVPSRAEIWLSHVPSDVRLPLLKRTFFTGEPLQARLVERWRATTRCENVVSLYGPTETTMARCYFPIEGPPAPGIQPLGYSVPESQSLVVNSQGTPCGVGEFGEVVVRTPYRSRGYINAEAKDTRRFAKNRWSNDPNDIVYFTGDMARYRQDGCIEFLGRRDHQVKVRGVRIELGEVESVFAMHPGIQRAVAAIHVDPAGSKQLVTYVQPKVGAGLRVGDLHEFGRARLLPAMVPSHFIVIDQLPLTANGKVDRPSLPAPDFARSRDEAGYLAPRNNTESKLAAIWSRLLQLDRVGVNDNFFDIGGHSLLGIQVFAEIEREFGAAPPLASLFQFPTVAGLAQIIDDGVAHYSQDCLVKLHSNGDGVPLVVFHNAAGEVAELRALVDRLGSDRPIFGVQAPWRRGEPLLFDGIPDRVSHYIDEICAQTPAGPLVMLGYCHGGKLAYEAACQLQERGRDVPLVVLIDSRAQGPGQLQSSSSLREQLLVDLPRAVHFVRNWLHEEYYPADRELRRAYKRKFFSNLQRLRRNAPDRIDFSELVFELAFQLSEYSPRLRKLYYRLASNNLKSARQFDAKKFAGEMLLVRPERKEHFGREPLDVGWGDLVQGPVKIIRTPAHHAFMVREQHVDKIVGPIANALQCIDEYVGAAHSDEGSAMSVQLEGKLCLEGASG